MSKLGDDGKPIFNEKGKVMKGPKYFTPNLKTKILIHGYGDTGTTDWVIRVKDRYLQKGRVAK